MRKKTFKKTSKGKDNLLEVKVKNISADGEGIGHIGSMLLYIPFGVPGDLLKVKIEKKSSNFAVAKIVEILEPSSLRVTPLCPIFPKCGGCQWQMISYEGQLRLKEQLLKDAFRKYADIEDLPVEPIVGMETPWHFRNKAQYPLKRVRDGKVLLGYYQKGTHRIIDLNSCPVQLEAFNPLVRGFKSLIEKEPITVYDEKTHKGKLRYLVLRGSERLKEILLVLVMKLPATSRALAEKIISLNPTNLVGVVENLNPKKTNAIFGERTKAITGRSYYIEEIFGLRLRISATSFFQVNTSQVEKLLEEVISLGGEKDYVIDTYSGVGLFSLAFARYSRKVIGIEEAPSYHDSLENIEINSASNVEFIHGKVEDHLPYLGAADLLILDPPRKGLSEETLKAIFEMMPAEIAYISCNPVTLARDSAFLLKNGYHLLFLKPFDFMPHTYHIETLSYFAR